MYVGIYFLVMQVQRMLTGNRRREISSVNQSTELQELLLTASKGRNRRKFASGRR